MTVSTRARVSGSERPRFFSEKGVNTRPGATQLTATPRGPNSAAHARVSCSSAASLAGDAGNAYDAAPAPLGHQGRRRPYQQEGTPDVEPERPVEGPGVHFRGGRGHKRAAVVHQYVHPPEGRDGLLDQPARRAGFPELVGEEHRL